MKKLLTSFLLGIFFLISATSSSYAKGDSEAPKKDDTKPTISIKVTEKLPWMECKTQKSGTETVVHNCEIESGFGTVKKLFSGMLKYVSTLILISGVLFLVISGVMYSMGGMDPNMKETAKKRIPQVLIGIVILFIGGMILGLFPWIFEYKGTK
ncbi:MAG: hypothetical protein GY828_05235 [Candidatus Gracilibacteria bacterium]|nr:hypothetical protein [Candidatus Gracilibacteria bacterium]